MPEERTRDRRGLMMQSRRRLRRRSHETAFRSGFFRVQAVNNRWWIIDADNHPFLSMGINHIAYKGEYPLTVAAEADDQGYAPYVEAVDRRYGGDAQVWAAYQAHRLRRWGFNTVGCWSSPEMYDQSMPYVLFMQISAEAGVGRAERHRGEFPDVFSPSFRTAAERRAEQVCGPRRDDPLLVGYFTDNEHDWHGWRRNGQSLYDYFFGLPSEAPGKQATAALLRERYGGELSALNTSWDLGLGTFDDLLQMEAMPPGPGADIAAVQADKDAFLALTAERYFAECERAIYQVDANHMVLGVRFAGGAPQSVIEACGRHVDILSINNYGYDAPTELLWDAFETTHCPMMITEWSVKAMDSGLPNTKGAAIPVYSQEDRADGYERYVTQALSLPFVVGLHWFQYTDQPQRGRWWDGENSNYGVVDVEDEPYCTLVERMRQVNGRAIEIAKAATGLS